MESQAFIDFFFICGLSCDCTLLMPMKLESKELMVVTREEAWFFAIHRIFHEPESVELNCHLLSSFMLLFQSFLKVAWSSIAIFKYFNAFITRLGLVVPHHRLESVGSFIADFTEKV